MDYLLISLLVVLLLLYLVAGGDSATDDGADVAARLLDFKRPSIHSDPNNFLTTWSSSNSSTTNPCSWNGVICSSSSSSSQVVVIGLNFTNAGLIGNLRIDLLTTFPSLTHLHFSGNSFSGSLSLYKIRNCNFQFLDFSFNNFTESISDTILLSCKRLASLNLSNNSIPGLVQSTTYASSYNSFLSSIRELDLSRNRFSDFDFFNYSLTDCVSLNLLNFSNNKLSGRLPRGISSSCQQTLSVIDLSYNNLTSGDDDLFKFDDCRNLTVLDLSHNAISGIGFPPNLSTCRNLHTIDLSHNAFHSNISQLALGSLPSLQYLSLAHNRFAGTIPRDIAQTCGSLRHLDLSNNLLTGGLPVTFKSCSTLQTLNLGGNQLSGDFLDTVVSTIPSLRYLYVPFNNITGSLPNSLLIKSSIRNELRVIDLSSNGFTGTIPSLFCSSSSSSPLEKILLPNNFLSGGVPSEIGNCKNLKTLDLSFNNINGSIPSQVWELPLLTDLVMWANNITGEIPDTITSCSNNGSGGYLQTLILNNNLMTGVIPESLAACTNLIWVSLSSNKISGEIPVGFGKLKNLAILQLGNNLLTGVIPPELGKCQSLIWLDLNSNNLTGSIPPQLADQAGLVTPGIVSGKQFAFVRNEGGTSCRGAGGLAEFEGIRTDRLANLPTLHACPSIRIYTGLTVYSFAHNGSMIYLDLSYNSLYGKIPDSLGSMSYLQVLNLGHNGLTGTIPDSLGGLKLVGVLDLSHNDLEGFVPGSLGTLTFLSDLDVSNNNLTGPIPTGGQLTTFPASRYENNSGLCGLPLLPCDSSSTSGSHSRNSNGSHGKKQSSMAGGVIIGILIALFCIIGLILVLYRMKVSQQKEDKRDKYIESLPTSGSSSWKLSGVLEPLSINIATFEKPLRKLTFGHLLEATHGFSADSLIGSGGFGEVYKAQLRDGSVVAIKKLIPVTGQGEREFTAEMETIGKIKHRNLVPLLGYCRIGEERLLVYEYMKWGSLETVLHERRVSAAKGGGGGGVWSNKLDWAARRKIAIGAARGLAFLHHSCIPHIIHRDMKSSNVLLDENLEARVSDFGMARLMNALDTHLSVSTLAGTPGYVPPEYYQSFRCTTKGDVYSYGVILLELLSGKRPIDPSVFGDDNNLVGWAKQLHREKRSSEIIESELLTMSTSAGHESTPAVVDEAELHQYLKIAFECLDDRPFRRPTMIQVMAMFKELQMDSESDILDGFSLKETVLIEESREKEP